MKLGIFYRAAFKFWRMLPAGFCGWVQRNPTLMRLKNLLRDFLARFATRDDIYSKDYYTYVDDMALRSASIMVEAIVGKFRPRIVVDVGCGTGALLDAFRAKGCKVSGYEYSDSGLEVCRRRHLEVQKFNIEKDSLPATAKADIVTCTEVAEHINNRYSDKLVGILCGVADTVIFTAATPGQGGGVDHVNEQPHEFWIELFGKHGYLFDEKWSLSWRKDWEKRGVATFYFQNLMIFRSEQS